MKSRKLLTGLILGTASLFALAPAVLAQSDDAILVTGTALPAPLSDEAYSIVTLSEDRLDGTASGRIEDALRDVAGLQQFRRTDARSANATSQGATLRGLGGNASSRALLVLDGVPQSDPFGGWVTWPAFSTIRLSQIRVTRGGGSGAYGSGALSGTIEMESGTGKSGLSGDLSYGSRDSVDANMLLGGALGSGRGFITASYARGDGFIPIIDGQRGLADQRAPYEQASVAARGIVPVGQNTELQASILGFTDRRTRGTILSGNGGDGADASLRLVHDTGYGRWDYEALVYLQLRKFQSRFTSINAARDTVTQSVDQFNVPSTGMGARFELRPPLGSALEMRLGADWRRTTGTTNELFTYVGGSATRAREAGGQSETLGGFAELSGSTGIIDLTASGRVDRWWLRNGRLIERTIATGAFVRNEIAPDRSGTEWTGRAGLSARLPGRVKLRSAAYLGWRLPTLNELYRPFRVGADATAANPALKPERMKGAELGLEWTSYLGGPTIPPMPESSGAAEAASRPFVRLGATLFTNKLTDAIGNVTLGSGPGTFPGVGFVGAGGAYRQRLNLDAINARGVELDLALKLGSWHVDASYAYTHARVRATGAALPPDGLIPAQVPSHMASATFGWKGLSATARYVASQYEDDGNSRKLRNALTFDAVTEWPLSNNIALTLRGENLSNARVEAAISGAGVIERASPRTLWIGLKLYGK
ncbi:MAG TPA: TonB-dependent receptor [Chakrabartia sp.]|nr:TonB-dependent receptor [Chakrabartia sp.]